MTWNDSDANSVVIPMLWALDVIFLATSPTTSCLAFVTVGWPMIFLKIVDKSLYRHNWAFLYAYVSEPWRFCHAFLQYSMLIYLVRYQIGESTYLQHQLVSLACFLAYFRLISYLRLKKAPRKLIATIVYVAKKSMSFYVILMIYIVATTFSMIALRDSDDFTQSFQLSYRLAFADFEDFYHTKSELVAFLLVTFFGPLLLLNLLITIMADAHQQCQENWDVEEIREIYYWAKEVIGMIVSLVQPIYIFGGNKIVQAMLVQKGYIHYCIPDPTEDTEDHELWQGQVNTLQGSIRHSGDRIISTFHNSSGRNDIRSEDTTSTDISAQPRRQTEAPRRQTETGEPALTHRIEAWERNIDKRSETLEQKIYERLEDLERKDAEREDAFERITNNKMKELDEKMNQIITLVKRSRAT